MSERIVPEKGDLVDVAPHREGVFGVRLGKVEEILLGETAWISVAGERWLVTFDYLTVVFRPA